MNIETLATLKHINVRKEGSDEKILAAGPAPKPKPHATRPVAKPKPAQASVRPSARGGSGYGG